MSDFQRLTTGITGNVLDQIKAQLLLPSGIEPPAWIDGAEDWPADEILVARNGLIHLPTLASGGSYLRPLTPRFFTTAALDYAFDAAAPAPAEWLAFLNQLWPDDPQAVETLQEWLGYLLTPDTRQQKILLLVGPSGAARGRLPAWLGPGRTGERGRPDAGKPGDEFRIMAATRQERGHYPRCAA